jgi:hypothetical protein
MKRKRNPGSPFPHFAYAHSPSKTGVNALYAGYSSNASAYFS